MNALSDTLLLMLWWIAGFGTLLVLLCIYGVNSIISLEVRADASLSDVDTALKKRHDLLPNLLEIAKGYMQHEKNTFTEVARLRAEASRASSPLEADQTEHNLSSSLNTFFILVEQYPELKAVEQFRSLQSALSQVEDNINRSRRYYNAVVRDYNTLIHSFPVFILALLMRKKPKHFFQIDASDRSNPSLS